MPRQAVEFDEDVALKVEILVAVSWSEERIARAVGCSRPTLRRLYADNLKYGRERRVSDILMAMHDSAVRGKAGPAKRFLQMAEKEPPAPIPAITGPKEPTP